MAKEIIFIGAFKMQKIKYGSVMPRTEAIEKMAKALYAHTWKSRTPMVRVQNWEIGVTDQNKKKYLGLAEAALNALLGGGNER